MSHWNTSSPADTRAGGPAALEPAAAVGRAVSDLLAVGLDVSIGVALGMVAARVMRARHLHWGWSAAALGPVAFAHGALAGSTPVIVTAALCAALFGRRWHREDLEAGVDLAQLAARRLRPLDVARALAMRVVAVTQRSDAGSWLRPGQLVLGREQSGRPVSIPFADRTGGAHALVLGATRSGKTVTQTWIATRAIQHGMGAIIVDPKGDRVMRAQISAAAHAAHKPFIEWSPVGPCVYNPYARGSETEIADKLLAGERFTEPHYLRQAQRYLGFCVRALRAAGEEATLQSVVDHLEPARLERLARWLPEQQADATQAYLDSLSARQRSDLGGVRDRLAILAESDVGAWLDPRHDGVVRFDLAGVAETGAIAYFDLQADSRPLLTEMLGAAIVQDLQTMIAALQAHPVPTLVVIDEFSALAAEQVARLFGRAGSARVSLLLATQELSDLRLPGRERLLERIMGNLSTLIAHRQVVPASAELIASLAGTRGAWRTVCTANGGWTRTRVREGVLQASEIMSLDRGSAAVIVPSEGCRTRIARVHHADGQ
jgi:type IV secretory pathway TraG/TraD family ATPase VirD4